MELGSRKVENIIGEDMWLEKIVLGFNIFKVQQLKKKTLK